MKQPARSPRDADLERQLAAAHARIATLTEALADARRDPPSSDDPGADGREAQFRIRNLLAIIRSVFQRTVAAGASPEEMVAHFTGRLDALARRQASGAVAGDGMIDLEDLIRDELLSVGEGEGPRLSLAGPAVALAPRQAELVGLALHELLTNAVKYGALSAPAGTLAIAWRRDAVPSVTLDWIESGVAVLAAAPLRSGFGRELIEQALPYQLGATTRFALCPGGVQCAITIPLG